MKLIYIIITQKKLVKLINKVGKKENIVLLNK